MKLDLRNHRTRKERSDKKINVNPALDQDTHNKLKKLSVSCDVSKTKMAEMLLRMALNHPNIIQHFQDHYNKDSQYRVIPVKQGDKIVY
ncbi:hypothetical protein HMPREF3291_03540 [Bacillus sp. HMSC76G11]|nr:hypothetical protein HMPREF3291_03540 [Bacillus sp. HMSC76G11]